MPMIRTMNARASPLAVCFLNPSDHMSRFLYAILLLMVLASSAWAQAVGDAADSVASLLGKPTIVRATARGEEWIYADGLRVTVKDARVVAVEGAAGGARGHSESRTLSVVPERERTVEPDHRPAHVQVEPRHPRLSFKNLPDWAWFPIGVLGLVVLGSELTIVIKAFKVHTLWGMGSLLLPVVGVVFVIIFWSEAKRPFLLCVAASCAMFALAFFGELSHALAP